MNASTNITVNLQLLAQLVDCLSIQKQFNPLETEQQKQLQQVTEQSLSAIGVSLSQMITGQQSFAGNDIGQHVVDGTKSSFL